MVIVILAFSVVDLRTASELNFEHGYQTESIA